MQLAAQKREWRRRMRGALGGLGAERVHYSQRVQEILLGWEFWRRAQVVLLYAALPVEPATERLCREAWKSGKGVVFPRTAGERLELYHMGPEDVWEVGQWGLLEPGAQAVPAGVGEVDLAMVPGLGFDHGGRRLGRGRGYFDRLLAEPGFRAVTVGCVFSCCLAEEALPAGEWDAAMDYVVSECGLMLAVR